MIRVFPLEFFCLAAKLAIAKKSIDIQKCTKNDKKIAKLVGNFSISGITAPRVWESSSNLAKIFVAIFYSATDSSPILFVKSFISKCSSRLVGIPNTSFSSYFTDSL